SAGDSQGGMIILDKTTRANSLQKLRREFRKVGTQWGSLKNIADTPFFVDSRASRLVQIADHVAYSVFRRYNAGGCAVLRYRRSSFRYGRQRHSRPGAQARRTICLHMSRWPEPALYDWPRIRLEMIRDARPA